MKAKPLDNSITGGGYIINTDSAGQYAADDGLKTNLGFNAKFNKNGTNVQGKINIIFRRMELDGLVHLYQIKSTAVSSLGVNAADGTATFLSKANLTDVTNPLLPVSLGGNPDLTLKTDDNGEPGTGSNAKGTDKVSVTLFSGSLLLYSSNWTGVQSQLQILDGGNIRNHPNTETLLSFVNSVASPIAPGDQTLTEGNSGTQSQVFTVKLSQASTKTVTVNYSTADNSPTMGAATAGLDYVAKSGTLTFAPGVTTQTITVAVNGDPLDEPDETFFLNLSNPVGAGIQDQTAVGMILDNDLPLPLQAVGGAATGGEDVVAVTSDMVQPLLTAAITQWQAAGADSLLLNSLNTIQVTITDLPGTTLALASQGLIVLDRDAAGYGWFIDPTPGVNEEFVANSSIDSDASRFTNAASSWQFIANPDSPAFSQVDLLTTIVHELGHALGIGHESGLAVMQDGLETGVRRLVGDNSLHAEGGVVAAASDTRQAITKPDQAAATSADFSRILGSVGTGSLIDWTEDVPGSRRTVDPSFMPKNRPSWVRSFLSDLGTDADEQEADHELEVTLPGPRI